MGATASAYFCRYSAAYRAKERAASNEFASFLEQIIQCRLRPRSFTTIFRHIGPRLRLEVIAKVGLILFAHLLRRGFLAVVRIPHVVFHAHLANMQLRIAGLAHIETAQRQTQRRERSAATPAD